MTRFGSDNPKLSLRTPFSAFPGLAKTFGVTPVKSVTIFAKCMLPEIINLISSIIQTSSRLT